MSGAERRGWIRNPESEWGAKWAEAERRYPESVQQVVAVVVDFGRSITSPPTENQIVTILAAKCPEAAAVVSESYCGAPPPWRAAPVVIDDGMAVSGSLPGYDRSFVRHVQRFAAGCVGALQPTLQPQPTQHYRVIYSQ